MSNHTTISIWRRLTAIAAVVLVIAGLSAGLYRVLLRVSEDAYATMLWRQSANTAGHIENYFRTMLANMAGISMTDPTAGLLETEYALDIVGMQRLDATGEVTGLWTPQPGTTLLWPTNLTAGQLEQIQQGLPVIACHAAPRDMHYITIHAPVFMDTDIVGAVGVMINAETVVWRCFPTPDEPLAAGFALCDESGRLVAESTRPDATGHLLRGKVLREGPLWSMPEKSMSGYRLINHTGAHYLAAIAPVMLPGATSWQVVSSITGETVAAAPRAMMKHLTLYLGVLSVAACVCIWAGIVCTKRCKPYIENTADKDEPRMNTDRHG
jgi:hypothetical protein